jgi:hypothetical protein
MTSHDIEEATGRGPMNSQTSCAKDFASIYRHLISLRKWSETLASDFNSVAAIMLNCEALKKANRSIQEARSVRAVARNHPKLLQLHSSLRFAPAPARPN